MKNKSGSRRRIKGVAPRDVTLLLVLLITISSCTTSRRDGDPESVDAVGVTDADRANGTIPVNLICEEENKGFVRPDPAPAKNADLISFRTPRSDAKLDVSVASNHLTPNGNHGYVVELKARERAEYLVHSVEEVIEYDYKFDVQGPCSGPAIEIDPPDPSPAASPTMRLSPSR